MSKFNAATAVEALDYDFTKYVPGKEGTIPEPTTKQVEDFFDAIRLLAKEARRLKNGAAEKINIDEMSMDEQVDALADLPKGDDAEAARLRQILTDAIVNLVGGEISAEDYEALPYRVQNAFGQWLAEVVRPEAAPTATKP